ncbi:nucleotide-diphospho-sugar transferase [Peziza echinospora]|nr:nucleotide-diphospho-sugar transferase [Peziza echinospora]
MLTIRRNLIIAVLLIAAIFFLYPRNITPSPATSSQTPVEAARDEAAAGSKNSKPPSSQKQQQLTLAKLQAMPLREQLEYHFPYNVATKFPAYIWQTWKYTPGNMKFEEKFRAAEASWTEKHPTFIHEVITDLVAVHLIKHLYGAVPAVVDAYNALPRAILKADFFRYLILLARGGVYTDIDTHALQPAQEWLPPAFKTNTIGLVVGIEADPDRPDWAEWYSRRIQFCQWTIQSKPGHPVLREIVANITETTLARRKAGTLDKVMESVVEFTGPAIWTDLIMEYFNNPTYFDLKSSPEEISWKDFTHIEEAKRVGDVVVLPITSFSPGIKHSGSKEIDDPMAFVFHNFEGSWKPEAERHIEPEEDRLKREKKEREQAARRARKEGHK